MGGSRPKVTQLVWDGVQTQRHRTLKQGLWPCPRLWLSRTPWAGASLPSAPPSGTLCARQKNPLIIPYARESTRPGPASTWAFAHTGL